MRFAPTAEQLDFTRSLDRLLAAADTVGAVRAWGEGDHTPGLALWARLAEQGVTALLVPEEHDGMGASPVELVLAFEVLGRHAVPGPWVETAAWLPAATDDAALLGSVAGGALVSVAAPPHTPYALDADVADHVLLAGPDGPVPAEPGKLRASVDRSRRLFEVTSPEITDGAPAGRALDLAALATAAQLVGAGERILADSVEYVKQRRQFGREIGSYQAIKHALADVRIALDFARPLVHGAAVTGGARETSAAKIAAADAAYLASRTGLQVHGAIGYTEEFDLSVWLTRVRALVGAWGTPAWHRARLLDSLVSGVSA